MTIGMLVANCHKHYDPDTGTLWLLDHHTNSWASVGISPQPPYKVRQGGHRQLWDEVHTAHQGWLAAGRPPVDTWLVTIEPGGQRIELSR